jgi:two-component system, LytTR family, sensor kinase
VNPKPIIGRGARKWLFVAGLWTVFCAFYTTVSYYYRVSAGLEPSFLRLLPAEAFYVGLWALLTPGILRLAHRYPVERRNWAARVPLHLGAAIGGAVLHRLFYDFVVMRLRTPRDAPFPWSQYRQSVVGFFDYGMFLYLIVLLIGLALEYYDRFRKEQVRASQLKADLAAARLSALQAQLQPHFLFNTLNAIAALIPSEPSTAERMVDHLADFLRATLDNLDATLVPLRRELALLDSYLEIETVRFGDRLRVIREIDPRTLDWEVPFLVLQPLVENAIRHGIGVSPGAGEVRLRTWIEEGTLALEVRNRRIDGPWPSREGEGHGVGLANTRARLEELYRDPQALRVEKTSEGAFGVTLFIPASTGDRDAGPDRVEATP